MSDKIVHSCFKILCSELRLLRQGNVTQSEYEAVKLALAQLCADLKIETTLFN
jgi:hypothetical protein